MTHASTTSSIRQSYDFAPGLVLARKYEVLARLQARLDSERYVLAERATGIERTARFFHPRVDPCNRRASSLARKLHALRHCDILVQYRTQETIAVAGRDVTFLVSDVVQGESLPAFLSRQPGGKLSPFAGLHLLHALVSGLERVHASGEHHGALEAENVIVQRKGLKFKVKLIDVSPERGARQGSVQGDLFNAVQIFYDAVGGARTYGTLPPAIKGICCGLRRPLMASKFPDASKLRLYLENLPWG